MYDIYDNGTSKYSSATDIYEKLCAIYQNEEASILGEMFADVSYENQDYYYTDKGMTLKEKFDAVSGFGDKMWLMDLAVSKLKASEKDPEWPLLDDLHDIIFEAVVNEDLAKRIGFKQTFVEHLLFGDKILYKQYLEEFEEELRELDRFGWHENNTSWQKVINRNNFYSWKNGYREFSNKIHSKILNMSLEIEMTCVAECRAFLNSYDDFIFGLKINQGLYEGLEKAFKSKTAQLQERYDKSLKLLHALAVSQGLNINLDGVEKLLESECRLDNNLLDQNAFRFAGEHNGDDDNG